MTPEIAKILQDAALGAMSPKEAVRQLVKLKVEKTEASELVLVALGGGDVIDRDEQGREYYYSSDEKAERVYVGPDGWPIRKMVRIIWRKWKTEREREELSHGLCIYDRNRAKRDAPVAFIVGFAWNKGTTASAIVYTMNPDEVTTSADLKELSQLLTLFIKPKCTLGGDLTPRFWLKANA